jgi:hypothetical protein
MYAGKMKPKMIFKTERLKADREAVCERVIDRFDLPLQILRLLCYFDDEDPPKLQELEKFLCGFHAPIMRLEPWVLPEYVEACISCDMHGDFLFDNLIYLCGRVCATDIGTAITLAHELQHFSQYSKGRALWDANSVLREKSLFKPCDLPSEREAMIASKRVAEVLFDQDAVARFAEARVVDGDDPQKWEFFLNLSSSAIYNLEEETARLIKALRGSLKGTDSLVEARDREHRLEK